MPWQRDDVRPPPPVPSPSRARTLFAPSTHPSLSRACLDGRGRLRHRLSTMSVGNAVIMSGCGEADLSRIYVICTPVCRVAEEALSDLPDKTLPRIYDCEENAQSIPS